MTDIKARTTMYKGIQMRSRLEADFAAFLDQSGAEWEYEPVCFAGPDGQWLPDFRVTHNGQQVYVEVKPESLLDGDMDAVLERMTTAWLTEPDAILQLTIWRYGEPGRCFAVMGIPPENDAGLTWWCSEGAGDTYPWPGMGQLRRFVEQARLEAESAQGSS